MFYLFHAIKFIFYLNLGRDKNLKIWDISRVSSADCIDASATSFIRPSYILHTAEGVNRIAWRPNLCTRSSRECMQLAATSIDRGDISLWEVGSPHVPACVLKGHTAVCTGIAWLDTTVADYDSEQYKSLCKEPKGKIATEDGIGGARAMSSKVCDGPDRLGVYQHILSIQKDGKILVQDVRNGYFPRQHMSSSVVAISSQGHLAYQTSSIHRGDPLGLFVSTDRFEDTIRGKMATGLALAPKLFKENPMHFGLPLSNRSPVEYPTHLSESASCNIPDVSTKELIESKGGQVSGILGKPSTPKSPHRLFISRLRYQKAPGKKESIECQTRSSNLKQKLRRTSVELSVLASEGTSSNYVQSSAVNSTGVIHIGLAEITSLSAAHEICEGAKGGGAEGGRGDPAIMSLLAKLYSIGRDEHFDRSCITSASQGGKFSKLSQVNDDTFFGFEESIESMSISSAIDHARRVCRYNFNVAKSVGLQSHAAAWEMLSILIPVVSSRTEKESHIYSLNQDFSFKLASELISSQLIQFLGRGDCQHFVLFCEVLRNSGLLETITSEMSDEIGSARQREAYLTYFQLLTKLELYDAATVLLKHSTDEYISALNKKGSLLHITCTKCGKELLNAVESGDQTSVSTARGSYCTKCRKCVGLCSLCYRVVDGLYLWCPVCCHGGHISCIKKWFSKNTSCPSGCGHPCHIGAIALK